MSGSWITKLARGSALVDGGRWSGGGGRCVARFRSTAQGTVQLDDTDKFVALRPGKRQLGVKQRLLVVEDFEVAGHAPFIANVGQLGSLTIGRSAFLEPRAELAESPVRDEAVGHIAEGTLR